MAAYTDSEPVTALLPLVGVWIHDPLVGGQDSAVNFPYGANQRELSLDQVREAQFYAGRMDPVVDYAEHRTQLLAVALDVPTGPTWVTSLRALQDFAEAKRTLVFRDNRGRAIYGQMEGYRERDAAWGTIVTFNVRRSSWDVETVVA